MKLGVLTSSMFAGFALLCAGSHASAADPVPPVPTPSLEGVAPEVREAVLAAHAQAIAEPESGQASGRLGMMLQANTLYRPAVLAYERAIGLEPDEFVWRYYLAVTLQEMSMLEEAVGMLSEALRIRPDYESALLRRGELLFKLGRFEESSTSLEALVAQHPESAQALYALAQLKQAQQELPAAEDLYRRASLAYPEFGAAYYGLSVTQRRLGQDEDSAKNLTLSQQYKDRTPQDWDPLLEQMLDLGASFGIRLRQALKKVQQGELREALKRFQGIIEQDPYNLDALLAVLFVGPVDGQPSEAEMRMFYENARQVAPENPKLYLYYGAVLRNYGRNDEVVAALNKAIELKPDYEQAHLLLGGVLVEENQPDQAVEHYRLALEAQPAYRPAQLQLAQTLFNVGRYREAIPELHRVLELDDKNTPLSMVFLAISYANSGEVGKAREYLDLARARVEQSGPPALLVQIEQVDQGLRKLGSRP